MTPEDFEKQACTAAAKNAGSEYLGFYGTGGWFMDTDPHIALSWLSAFGSKNIFDSSSNSYTFSTPEVEHAFTFLRQLAENLCAWNNEVPRPEESTEPYLYFPTHQVLLASLSVDELPYLAAAMAKAGNTDDWVIFPYPTEDGAGSMLTYGYSLGMFVASPAEQLASWLVIQWFAETGQVASLASMTDTLPVRISSVEEMNISSQAEQAIALLGLAATPPVDPSWRLVQPVLRDAMWENMVQFQLIHTIPNVSVRTVDELLAEMDETASMLTGE